MSNLRALKFALVFTFASFFTSAQASTVSSFGDGSNSLDSATGFLWRDVPLSINLSYDYVGTQFGIGGQFEGYRYATDAELTALYTNADITNLFTSSASPHASVVSLMNLLGLTFNNSTQHYVFGITGTLLGPGVASLAYLGYENNSAGAVFLERAYPGITGVGTSSPGTTVGSYLVRAPVAAVPFPAALPYSPLA